MTSEKQPLTTPDDTIELGGDPACWAHRICPECGRLNDVERPVVCEGCGERLR